MKTLLKYEFIKEKTAILVATGILGFAELVYFIGAVYYSFFPEATAGFALATIAAIVIMLFAITMPIVILSYSVKSWNSDLTTKTGYNLFLTSKSSYEIFGAKLLFSIITFFADIILFLILCFINTSIVNLLPIENPREITGIFSWVNNMNTLFDDFGKYVATIMFITVIVHCIYYLVLADSCVVFAACIQKKNKKHSGGLDFALFIGINVVIESFGAIVIAPIQRYVDSTLSLTIYAVIILLISIALYILSSQMLAKKLNL